MFYTLEINKISEEIDAMRYLTTSCTREDGYGVERKVARIEDTFEIWGEIEFVHGNKKEFEKLYSEWRKLVKNIYNNKNICIC